jgi:peptidyl-prolyl cis-trans isomerase SurA
MKRFRAIAAACMLGFVGVATEAKATESDAGDTLVDRIVAIVNDEPVTLYELRRASAPYLALERRRATTEEEFVARGREVIREALDNLVNDILINSVARTMSITIGPEKVDAHLRKLADDNGWTEDELAEQLKRVGFSSIADYRRHAEREMLKSQVLSIKVLSRIRIDERDVEARYQREVGQRGTIQERRAAHILLLVDDQADPATIDAARAKLAKAREDIAAGLTAFDEMARRISDDSNKSAGGDLGWFQRGDFDPSFDDVIFAMQEGELSVPFRSRFGMHLAVVTGIREREVTSNEDIETAKRRIRLELREREVERVYKAWLRGLRSEAFVSIRDDALL